jgi:hypothetical protein
MGPNVHVSVRRVSEASPFPLNGIGVAQHNGTEDESRVPLEQLSQLLTSRSWGEVVSLIHQYPTEISGCTMKVVCQGENYMVTPLHFAVGSIVNCPVPVLEALVQANPAALISTDVRRGLNPIHLGLLKGTVGIEQIDYLLSVCPEMALHADLDGNLPLHMAVEYASDAVIQRILLACPEAAGYKTKRQRRALHLLASSRCQIGGRNGHTGLDSVISLNTIKSLIEAYPEALQHPDLQGRLPLHLTVCTPFPRWDVIKLFSDIYPAALLVQDENHKIPLQLFKRFSASPSSTHSTASSSSAPASAVPDNDVILAFVVDRTNAEKRKNNVFHKYLGKVIPQKKKSTAAHIRAGASLAPTMDWTNCYG